MMGDGGCGMGITFDDSIRASSIIFFTCSFFKFIIQ